MTFVIMMHHTDHSGLSQPPKVGMMLQCSPGELLTRAAFMHHDDQGHGALINYAVIKGLNGSYDVGLCSHN